MMRVGIPTHSAGRSGSRARGKSRAATAAISPTSPSARTSSTTGFTIESLPRFMESLDSVGLSPKGACGDVVRNVTAARCRHRS